MIQGPIDTQNSSQGSGGISRNRADLRVARQGSPQRHTVSQRLWEKVGSRPVSDRFRGAFRLFLDSRVWQPGRHSFSTPPARAFLCSHHSDHTATRQPCAPSILLLSPPLLLPPHYKELAGSNSFARLHLRCGGTDGTNIAFPHRSPQPSSNPKQLPTAHHGRQRCHHRCSTAQHQRPLL